MLIILHVIIVYESATTFSILFFLQEDTSITHTDVVGADYFNISINCSRLKPTSGMLILIFALKIH